jgi:hypothetical protein
MKKDSAPQDEEEMGSDDVLLTPDQEPNQSNPSESTLALSINPIIDSLSRDLVLHEESLWGRIAKLKEARDTLETRLALKETYTSLADYYSSLSPPDTFITHFDIDI